MDFLFAAVSEADMTVWQQFMDNWVFILSGAFLAFELVRYAVLKRLTWDAAGDVGANGVVFGTYLAMSVYLYTAMFIVAFYTADAFALFDIETNLLTIALCVICADFAYYWEHRFSHRVNLAWATHSVHHSSPHYNISVAYRFGPMDDLWALVFNLPLVVIGFDPLVVFFSAMVVLQYQTFLHTEAIGKLPRPIEFLMNTPSHHRVHHGSNPQYLDKNYGGMFIVWDRLFGTFAAEREAVRYGLVEQIDSVNPFVVFFHGIARLVRKTARTRDFGAAMGALFGPPDWTPKRARPGGAPAAAGD